MNLQDILTILIPTFGFLSWIYSRIDKKFELMDKKFERMDAKFERMDAKFEQIDAKFEQKFRQIEIKMVDEFTEVKKALHSLDIRLTRLEGRFDERGYWESRMTGTHDEK